MGKKDSKILYRPRIEKTKMKILSLFCHLSSKPNQQLIHWARMFIILLNAEKKKEKPKIISE